MVDIKRPRITVTYAQSLDGSIAAQAGAPLPLSGIEATRYTHQLRAAHDAILVGIGTVLSDDPRLNVRLATGTSPRPIILDSELRCPVDARCLEAERRPIVITSDRASVNDRLALEERGVTVVRIPTPFTAGPYLDLSRVLEELLALDIRSIMVEGGAQVITSFLRSQLVDRLVITIAPVLVGGLHGVTELMVTEGTTFPRLQQTMWQQLGDDWVVAGIPDWTSVS